MKKDNVVTYHCILSQDVHTASRRLTRDKVDQSRAQLTLGGQRPERMVGAADDDVVDSAAAPLVALAGTPVRRK